MTINVVYTSGKVGSTTMTATLEAARPDEPTYTVRRLTPAGIAEHRAFRPIVSDDEKVAAHLEAEPDERVNLVTLTREPVAAVVSSFFYNAEHTHPDFDLSSASTDRIVELITSGAGSSRPTFHTDWFDIEFEPMTHISPYDEPFDRERGYWLGESVRFRALILRLEDLDRLGPPALRDFFATEGEFPMEQRANSASTRPYAEAYRRFLELGALPADWARASYGSAYAQHFYSSTELSTFTTRWTHGSSNRSPSAMPDAATLGDVHRCELGTPTRSRVENPST